MAYEVGILDQLDGPENASPAVAPAAPRPGSSRACGAFRVEWVTPSGPEVHTSSTPHPASWNRWYTCSPNSVGDHVGSWATSRMFS